MAAKFDPKAKAKRQKIVAAVLGLVLLGVLAWQVPSMLKIMNKKPPAAATATTPPVSSVPGTAPAAAPVAAPVASGTLSDSDPVPQASTGQLVSFDRFATKDPFAQQLTVPAAPSASAAPVNPKPAHAPTRSPSSLQSPQASATARTAQSAPKSAKISLNGVMEQISIGGSFPADDPLFTVVSLTKTKAKISISGGSLDSGASTVTLTKGKTLTLQNTVDGARYELVLRAVT
jgi:hypothetical protein